MKLLTSRTAALTALACILLAASPFTAEAGRNKPGGGSGNTSGSVSLVLLDATSDGPHFTDQVTFDVKTSYSTTWVEARCYQNSVLVYAETRGFFPDYPWGQTFTLGPTGYWTSGGASCVGDLYTTSRNKRVNIATTTFNVAP